jgi:glycosyltransferase involved in cell wall biosynthesis
MSRRPDRPGRARSAVLAPNRPGQPGGPEIARLSALGRMPRRDYVEVARALDADVIDADFMLNRASATGALIARRRGILPGVLYEAYAHRRRYEHVLAWSDRAGLPLALLCKLTGAHPDLSLLSVYVSQGKKAFLLKDLRVHTKLSAIMCHSSVQAEITAQRLRVPADLLHYVGKSVDERFWAPLDVPPGDGIVSVGWEARDYPTLMEAVADLPVRVDIAVGTLGLWSSVAERPDPGDGVSPAGEDTSGADRLAFFDNFRGTLTYPLYKEWIERVRSADLPSRIRIHHQLSATALRELYARSRFAVVPLHDVEFDAGVTSVTEALSMGKAVIATRSQGQVDVLRHGEHGLYVPPGDPRALRQAVDYLLTHPDEAARMGRAGRELVVRNHALDAYVSRVADIVTRRETSADGHRPAERPAGGGTPVAAGRRPGPRSEEG